MTKLGVRCGVIIGETDKATREAHIQRFKQDPYFNLINVNVFNEGMDVPEIETIILAKTIASDHLAKQILGRGLRKCVGKRGLYIYDLCVNQNIYSKLYRDIALSPLELLLESKNFSRNNQYDSTKKKKILQYLREIPDELLSTLQSKLKIFEFKDSFIIPELSDFKFVYEGNIGYLAGKMGRADVDYLFAVEQTPTEFICYEGNTRFRKNSAEEVADYLQKKIERNFIKFITYKNERGIREGARSEPTDNQISLLCSLCGLPYNEDIILGLKTLYTKYSIGIEIDGYLAPKKCKSMVERIKLTITEAVKLPTKSSVSLKDQRKQKTTKVSTPQDWRKLETTKVHQSGTRLPTIYVESNEAALVSAAKKVKGRVSKIKKAVEDHTEYCGAFWQYKE
jgi:DNA-binding FrmR family transcriptional regulator